jgi:uncharacterized membrane protein (UPF0127 family)
MKRTVLPALLALLALGGQCRRNTPSPPVPTPADRGAVTIRGKSIPVVPLARYDERRHAIEDHGARDRGTGLLLAYDYPRFHSLYFDLRPVDRTFVAAFIGADRVIADAQTLVRGKRGITSEAETPYVLVVDAETFVASGAAKGDRVEFSSDLESLRPEPMPALKIEGVPIRVELSTSYEERQRGLMYRTRMSDGDGMLFAYPREEERSFWMGYCYLPLSIAYIKSDGTIAKIHHDMMPYESPDPPPSNYKTWPSEVPVQYVLEVNHGFFKKHGIAEGMKVLLPTELRRYRPD